MVGLLPQAARSHSCDSRIQFSFQPKISEMSTSHSASAMLALFLFSGGLFSTTLAQNMPRTVIGSAGTTFTQAQFGDLHFTVGEVASSRLENGLVLTEGFHQTYFELLVSVYEPSDLKVSVTVYPNPTAEYLNLDFTEAIKGYATLTAADGKQVLTQQIQSITTSLNLSALPVGIYFLQVRDEAGRQNTYQVAKVRN